jgi:thiamine-phosphate pyrophosphorylase
MLHRVRECVAARVALIQIREHGLEARDLYALACDFVQATAGSSTRVIVNDRLDVAIAAGAHGVHLPSLGIPAAAARLIAPRGFLIGRSVHGAAEARASTDGVDYLILGTVFATSSKPGEAAAGPGELREAVQSVSVPVLAIGGVGVETLPAIAGAGASGFAAIGTFANPPVGGIAALMTAAREAYARHAAAFSTLRE